MIQYIIVILFFIIQFTIVFIRKKENKLEFQDKFIQQSLHEIKTPLSIISLNNELRCLKYGDDDYSLKINNSIQNLKNSYEDMVYMTNLEHKITYPMRQINLSDILKQRVKRQKVLDKTQRRVLLLHWRMQEKY